MKKLISIVLLTVVVFGLMAGCSNATQAIKSISIKILPSKTDYLVGDKLDLSGMVVVATYFNGKTSEIPVGKYTTTPVNGSKLSVMGILNFVVRYGGKEVSLPLSVSKAGEAVALTDIRVTTPPDKTEFYIYESLDLTGMVVTAYYSDGTEKTVTDYTTDPVEGDDFSSRGTQTVTVYYSEGEVTKTTDFSISVIFPVSFLCFMGKDVQVKPSGYWNATTKEYSIDLGANWYSTAKQPGDDYYWDGTSITQPSDFDKVIFRGLGGAQGSSDFNGHCEAWTITGSCVYVSGDIETILDYETVENDDHPRMESSCFYSMFRGQSALVDAAYLSLPAEVLSDDCYRYMFSDCTSLTRTPEHLPATVMALYCYEGMFMNCTSLTSAPELPALMLEDGCYLNMFRGCTALTSAPELPAEYVPYVCYARMFMGCTSLTTAPALPAEAMGQFCYERMFCDCTNLTSAPELPATILASACYEGMFQNCISLTTAPVLPSKCPNYKSYQYMFSGCTNLNSVTVSFLLWLDQSKVTVNWLEGVAKTGTFTCPDSVDDERGASYIPEGWTRVVL